MKVTDKYSIYTSETSQHHVFIYFILLNRPNPSVLQHIRLQLLLNSPLLWKAFLRLSSTSANPRTSFTSCITYSGSTPGAPVTLDVSPMLLKGQRCLELRPISKVLVDPADTDLEWGLERCCGKPWACFVSPPPLLLLLFRSIPAASAAATLHKWYSRPLNPRTHHTALVPRRLNDRKRRVKRMCVIMTSLVPKLMKVLYNSGVILCITKFENN